jgi:tetratricopeptide (TPR) repeat protein
MKFFLISAFLILLHVTPASAQFGPVYQDPINVISSNDSTIIRAIQEILFGTPDNAIRLMKKNRNTKTKYAYETYYLTGYAYKLKGDLTKAIQYYSKAIHDNTSGIPALFERANTYMIRGNFGQAVFDYDRVIRLDSNFLPAYNNRAYARIRNYGDKIMPKYQLKLARQDLIKVLDIQEIREAERAYEYYYNLGVLDLYLSDYHEAKLNFDKAISINPNLGKLFYFRGASNFLRKAYKEADVDFIAAEQMGFNHQNTPEFRRIIELVAQSSANGLLDE